jgi:GNAT superfamily N-acetyltransferase
MPLYLRPAIDDDVALILQLEELGMRGYAEALWGVWRPSATAESLVLDGHAIIEVEGDPVGCVAVDWHPDHLKVRKLYIHPDHRNHGFGAEALRMRVDEAAARGLPTRLTVLTTNPARRFYEREGFRVASETPERRLMVKPLPAS